MKALTAALSLILTVPVLLIGSACAKPAPAPTPAPATKAAPAPAPKPAAPAPAPAAKSDPLTQIVEGARKEGTVSASLAASYTPAPLVQLLRNNIKEKYGVDLDIKVTASKGMAAMLADMIMQNKTGTAPTYDVITLGSDYIPQGMKEGVFEKIDWKALLPANTAPGVVPQNPLLSGGPVMDSDASGLMYNSRKIAASEVPKTLSDLANPKWKGRLGVMDYAAYWARWAYVLGKDKTLATLRGILKNQPILGQMAPLNNRYLVGEADMVFMSSAYIMNNRSKGLPTDFRALDFLELRDYKLLVVKNAQHPNAAKLLVTYLASADGAKFSVEKVEKGHSYYPGNHLYDTALQAKKDGIPVHTLDNNAALLDFVLSPQYNPWQKEIETLIRQGG